MHLYITYYLLIRKIYVVNSYEYNVCENMSCQMLPAESRVLSGTVQSSQGVLLMWQRGKLLMPNLICFCPLSTVSNLTWALSPSSSGKVRDSDRTYETFLCIGVAISQVQAESGVTEHIEATITNNILYSEQCWYSTSVLLHPNSG